MTELINQLECLPTAKFKSAADSVSIVLCQKSLSECGLCQLPDEFVSFLHHFNAFAYQGAFIFGTQPFSDFFLDIVKENMLADIPEDLDIVILGCNGYDYLAYNADKNCYQIFDRAEFMVLAEYDSCADAIRHILRIDTL